jgi:NADH dehydrogenase
MGSHILNQRNNDMVGPFMDVQGVAGVFVVGDASSVIFNGRPVPGVAQAAIQQGRYVGRLIWRQLEGYEPKQPFRYFDKGNMAVVGENFVILESGRFRTSGFATWLVWVFLHLMTLPQLQNRLRVQRQWLWSYFTGQRSSRLIPEPSRAAPQEPGSRTDSPP